MQSKLIFLLRFAAIAGFLLTANFAEAQRRSGPSAPTGPKAHIVSFGFWGDQSVFLSEARGAAAILSARFNGGGRAVVRANSRGGAPANAGSLHAAVQAAARRMDQEQDVLFVFLTSHGTRAGIAVRGGGYQATLTPGEVGSILEQSGARYRVLIVSACYSGVFTGLASSNTAVITASTAWRTSFGCQDGVAWTYFGNAFFNQALRRTADLQAAYTEAVELVTAREQREGFTPSYPQFSGGSGVLAHLRGR